MKYLKKLVNQNTQLDVFHVFTIKLIVHVDTYYFIPENKSCICHMTYYLLIKQHLDIL